MATGKTDVEPDPAAAVSTGPAVPGYVARLAPYVPGKPIEELEREIPLTRTAKLASNENPWGPSPLAVEAMTKAAAGCHRYPDGSAYYLRLDLAARHGVPIESVIVGNGSTDIIEITARTFLADGDPAVAGASAFIMFRLAVESVNGGFLPIPMPDHRQDLPAMAAAARRTNAKIVYVANPNNPTGTYATTAELDRFLDEVPREALVILDEAYIDFVDRPDYPDGLTHFRAGRNVLVLRTFSKIHGLAGLRIGYGIGPARVLAEMNKIRSPFNTSLVAQAAARAALGDEAHVRMTRERTLGEMAFVEAGMRARGIRFVPSVANFVLVETDRPGGEVYADLLQHGVIARPVGGYGLPFALRVSIGTRAENELFFEAWDAVAAERAAAGR